MDFPFSLNGSIVLAAAVAVWLLWVAPQFLKNRRAVAVPTPIDLQEVSTVSAAAQPMNNEHEVEAMMVSRTDTVDAKSVNSVDTLNTVTSASGSGAPSSGKPASGAGSLVPSGSGTAGSGSSGSTSSGDAKSTPGANRKLKIRYGRLTFALIGLVALVALPITVITSAFSLTPWLIPLVALMVMAIAVAGLRVLARRDQTRRDAAAFETKARSAAGLASTPQAKEETPAGLQTQGSEPVKQVQDSEPVVQVRGSGPVIQTLAPFDAQDASTQSVAVTQHEIRSDKVDTRGNSAAIVTRDQLRSIALEQVRVIEGKTNTEALKNTTGWKPSRVPRPTYTEAPKAERAQVTPVEIPEQPKPEGKVNIGRELAVKKAAELEAARLAAQSEPAAAASASAETSKVASQDEVAAKDAPVKPETRGPDTGKLNLDDVLQRRRA